MLEALIIDAVRIPRTRVRKDGGRLASVKPVALLKPLFQVLAVRNDLPVNQVDDIILGCATQVGEQGTNLARLAALYAGWDHAVPGLTLNRFCCSGLDALNLAASKIAAGFEHLVVAGGVESLSRVPMFADKGAWFADPEVAEATRFVHMAVAADLLANRKGYTRKQLEQVALNSHRRAAHARATGYFQHSLIPVTDVDGTILADRDDAIRQDTDADALAKLKPVFQHPPQGDPVIEQTYPHTSPLQSLHTAGTAPAIVDGASLILLASPNKARDLNLKPRARLKAFANTGGEPVIMLTGHMRAAEKLFNATGLTPADIDLWEINESFAASVLAFREHFGLDDDRVNVNGSAISMGHPLGATGGNLAGALLDELERRDLKRGMAAIPGGAGVGTVTLIERL
ncbi:MAG: acetyl-CoA C-acyltransferase [Acidobacteriota bacterium]|nr:acetyl-CoA C-acyltransferase [Acidobacteriota bacterium]